MPDTVYTPWHPQRYPRLSGEVCREIVGITWRAGLVIEIADGHRSAVSMWISFPIVHAFQGIDEGYRLAAIPVGDSLIYTASHSRYLAAFREGAASTMDPVALVHWIIVSGNQCVDVVSQAEPLIAVPM